MRGLLLAFACLTAHATAHAVPIFVETWSNAGSTSGFTGWPSDNLSLYQDSGSLVWVMEPSLSMGLIAVDDAASEGVFVGDVAATHLSYYAFDFRPDADTYVGQLGVYFDSPDSTWYCALSLPTAGTWNHYRLTLDTSQPGWTQQYGTESLAQLLSHATCVALEWGVPGGGGSGRLDNFEIGHTPEPTTLALLGLSIGGLALKRRIKRKE